MPFQGHIENGVVVFDEPVAISEGTAVRVDALAQGRNHDDAEDSGCFHQLAPAGALDAPTKDALRALLTRKQYEALMEVVDQGGPDVGTVRKLRAASQI